MADSRTDVPIQATQDDASLGTVKITRHVLANIIELAVLAVDGVARLAPVWSPWPRLLQRAEPQRGLAVNVHNGHISVDLYLILRPGVNMAQVGRAVQDAVTQAIAEMVGLVVDEVNCYIQDIA
jgi:uncharacterized alkaline shock family protein YloU